MFPLFRDLMDKSYEVHFKGRHVMDFPWMSFTGNRHEETEVTMLQHVTHYSEADGIIWINNDEKQRFIFKPAVKQGKSDDIRMTTYRCESNQVPNEDTCYTRISHYDDLLPGYYSWWSPYKVTSIRSLFGTIRFNANFNDLMQCYKESYDPPLEEIHLRCGGTLRYNKKACKVIIVCSGKYYPTPGQDYPIIERFKEKESIKLQYENPHSILRKRETYDEFAFAFYFPEYMVMKCSESKMTCSEVYFHDEDHCAKKCHGKCPDGEYDIPHRLQSKMDNLMQRETERKERMANEIHASLDDQDTTAENSSTVIQQQSEAPDDTVQSENNERTNKEELSEASDNEQPSLGEEEKDAAKRSLDDGEEEEPPKKFVKITEDDDTI